jgi:hypothetical protein
VTTIEVPPQIPLPEAEPEVEPLTCRINDDIRSAATAVGDVSEWAKAHGAPADWSGDAAEAARNRFTRLGRDADVVVAALEKATLGIDVYLDQMTTRRHEYDDLLTRRTELNSDISDLLGRIDGAPESQAAALRHEAQALRTRSDEWYDDFSAWQTRVAADEDRLIAVLRSVDTVGEGADAATDPGRIDTRPLLDHLKGLGNDTDAINAWWKGLTPAEREALKISDPDVVGNTNGIPTGDRDEANRAGINRDVESLLAQQVDGQELSDAEQRWLARAQATMEALSRGEGHLDVHGQQIDVNLMVYLPHAFGGDGAAAVAYGDPDTADHTAVIVPGLTNDMSNIDGQGKDALALFDQANADGSSVATIAWMGYDAPSFHPGGLLGVPGEAGDFGGVSMEQLAENGGHQLSDFIDGLNSTHEGGDSPHLTVIGHSYGSTTAAHAAADGLDADALVLLGSPGAGGGVHDVSGLHMPGGQVYVGSMQNDPVTWLGGEDGVLPYGFDDDLGLGQDPAQSSFGAHNIPVGDGRPFHVDEIGTIGIGNHSSYFDENSTSLASVADVVDGHPLADTGGRDESAHQIATDWAEHEAAYQAHQLYDHYVAPVVDPVVSTAGAVYSTGQQVVAGTGYVITHPVETFSDLWPDDWP